LMILNPIVGIAADASLPILMLILGFIPIIWIIVTPMKNKILLD
jgi:hypothetical protein